MNHQQLKISRTAHFFTLGQPGPQVRQLWIVCHGYAQNADDFLENFRLLENEHTLVVAPEGLNHFYKKGFAGDVGANWMTRRWRESQISDNAYYLQTLYNQCVAELPPDVRIVLLGFSQGTATVCRWILEAKPHFQDLILWAGLPPEDLDYRAHKDYLASKNLYLLYGSSDPFLTPERMEQVTEIAAKNDIDFGQSRFEGGHDIPEEVLLDMLEKLK